MKIHSLATAAIEAFTGRKYFAALEQQCEDYAREGKWEEYRCQRNYTNFKKAEVRVCQGLLLGTALASTLMLFGRIYGPTAPINEQPPCPKEMVQTTQPAIVMEPDGGSHFEKYDGNVRTLVAFRNGAIEMTETTPTGSRRIILTGDRALRGIDTMEKIKNLETDKGFNVPIKEAEREIDSLTRRLIVDLSNS